MPDLGGDGRGVRGGDERGGGKAGDGEGGEVVKARGAVANVAAVRLKRLQHKQRRKVDFLAREKWRSNQQDTQTATTVEGVV